MDARVQEGSQWWRRANAVLAVLSLAALCAFAAILLGAFAPAGALPLALDFDCFWSAAKLAVTRGASAAYDVTGIEAYERAHAAMPKEGVLIFYYPPSFLLLCLPLALLPYLAALFAFEAAQAALVWSVCKRIAGSGWGWLPVLTTPAVLMNMFGGQNGGLWASCLGLAALNLDRRPWLGGACLGLLSCKPQLAVCVPVALLAARRWRACAAAAIGAAALASASALVLGLGAWQAFLANAGHARADIETLPVKWPMMQSFYGALRLAGFSSGAGYAVQIAAAILALSLLARLCWRRPGAEAEMAALSASCLLVTPYLYDYDLVVLSVPMAWLAGQARRAVWLWGDKALLLLLYLAPFGARAAGLELGVTIAPPLLLALLLAIGRRAVPA